MLNSFRMIVVRSQPWYLRLFKSTQEVASYMCFGEIAYREGAPEGSWEVGAKMNSMNEFPAIYFMNQDEREQLRGKDDPYMDYRPIPKQVEDALGPYLTLEFKRRYDFAMGKFRSDEMTRDEIIAYFQNNQHCQDQIGFVTVQAVDMAHKMSKVI